MSTDDPVHTHVHTPGAPVLDRAATNRPWLGSAIARGDRAVVVATGDTVIVTDVDHQSGRIQARPGPDGPGAGYAGVEVEVTAAAHHPPLPDDCLEGLTIQQARELLAPVASDNGRYPQYRPDYFDRWVFGRARRDLQQRGQTILVAGQRCLVNTLDPPTIGGVGTRTYTAWITRRAHHPAAVGVWAYDIDLEPADGDRQR
jgi:hypothetical protein